MKYGFFSLIAIYLTITLNAFAVENPEVIYDKDDRKDFYEVKSALFLKLAKSTAALVSNDRLVTKGNSVKLYGKPLKELIPVGVPVCEKEKFSSQPTASHCSGFLVKDDILVTAGHCYITKSDCTQNSWVFNYKISDPYQTQVDVDPADVYQCKKVIKSGLDPLSGIDFAVIQLDRPNKGKALKVAKNIPSVGTALLMIGHPSGLPQKFTNKAKITAIQQNYFISNLDAFGGNSGSAVFNARTGEILGILASGEVDYVRNPKLMCAEVNIMNSSAAGERISSFKQFDGFIF